jgi:hypothetical protein
MDFVGRLTENVPLLGQFLPRTVRNLGSVLTLTEQGAGTVYSSTSRGRETNPSSRGVRATIVISGKSGTIDAVFTLRRYDKASGTYINMLSSASLTADGTTTLTVHPDLTAAANSIAKDFIGEEFDVMLVSGAGATPSFDATVGIELLP